MITVTIYKSQEDYAGFECFGHAGFANSGKDIVCAAVSVLVINTINSIDTFTDQIFTVDSHEKSGLIKVIFDNGIVMETKLLLDSMVLGLKEIEKEYGKKYLKLKFEEV